MDAAAAKIRTKHAKAKQEADEQAAIKRRNEADKRERERALRDDYPRDLEKCYKEIKKESSSGRNKANISTSGSHYAVIDKLIQTLKKDGYRVERGNWEGYEDYGDFNAPCNVWVSRSWLDVSW